MSKETWADQPERPLRDEHDDLYAELAANPELARVAFLLTSAPTERELDGLNAAVHAFRAHVSAPSPERRRRSMISTLAGAKLGAAVAALAVGAGGVAAATYVATSTPSKAGDHAPAAQSSTRPTPSADAAKSDKAKSGEAVGPVATGSAAYGLCTAWKGAAENGKALESVALENLVEAAGGKDKVEAFCAEVEAPGKSGEHATARPTDPGKPTDVPTPPAGKPTVLPTASKPADVPSPTHPTGKR